MICGAALVLLLALGAARSARAQTPATFVLTPAIVDTIDGNHVSMLTGETHFSIPALKMGDVSFTPFSIDASFGVGGIQDDNYGRIAVCESANSPYQGWSDCSATGTAIQAIYGEQRETFDMTSPGQYMPDADDGATFVDNGNTCIWTTRDGTQIAYQAYHNTGNPICQSNNILWVKQPDGRIATYYYYGALSTTYNTMSPILSIATNSGYMLKYIYSGTPTAGGETSVVAINRAFQYCDPTAVSCAISGTWPTATLSWTTGSSAVFTIQDEAGKQYKFGLDNLERIVSYQPPGATQPVNYYTLCTQSGSTMQNCWTYKSWPPQAGNTVDDTVEPMLINWVESATHLGQTWQYNYNFNVAYTPGWSTWEHSDANPVNPNYNWLDATGNATPGMESNFGPTDSITLADGTVNHFERNRHNAIYTVTTPAGMVTTYNYDWRGSLTGISKTPIPGSGQSVISASATYPYSCNTVINCNSPSTCSNMLVCDEPTSTTDFNGNIWNLTYDPNNGEVWTQTGPAVTTPAASGVHPQTRYFYAQKNAWYLSSSNVMTEDPNPIWVRTGESYCVAGPAEPINADGSPAASGAGCVQGNDEVVTTYDYGPASGPNNLLVRGTTVTAQGQTLRTCYGHDEEGNKIWETSPNANPASCPSY